MHNPTPVLVLYTVSLIITRNTYYIFILGDDTCVEQKSNCREFAHTKELSGDRRASE